MALKDIKSLKMLDEERQRLRQEQQQAVAGIKTNFSTEYHIAKQKIGGTSQQIRQGMIAVEQQLDSLWSGWRWPALGSLGALIGLLIIQWFSGGEDQEEEQVQPPTNESNTTTTRPSREHRTRGQESWSEAKIDPRLEDRIKIALAEFEAEKAEAEKPSALSTVLSIIGPMLLKELRNSDILQQFTQPTDLDQELQAFSDKMADELEAVKDTL